MRVEVVYKNGKKRLTTPKYAEILRKMGIVSISDESEGEIMKNKAPDKKADTEKKQKKGREYKRRDMVAENVTTQESTETTEDKQD